MTPQQFRDELEKRRRAERQLLRQNDLQHLERPRCHHCHKPLTRFAGRKLGSPRQFGHNGSNLFCSLNCGFRYAVDVLQS